MKGVVKKTKPAIRFLLIAVLLVAGLSCFESPVEEWSFGVMGDTQWTCPSDPEGTNPGKVSGSVISQLNAEFINKGVKFIVQMGDLIDWSGDLAARADAAQQLYDAGIGFFPMRGNHEIATTALGVMDDGYKAEAMRTNFPQTQGISNTFGATNFSYPETAVPDDLKGLNYSFDYGDFCNNVRIVVLDVFATPDQIYTSPATWASYGYSIGDQQEVNCSRLL